MTFPCRELLSTVTRSLSEVSWSELSSICEPIIQTFLVNSDQPINWRDVIHLQIRHFYFDPKLVNTSREAMMDVNN